MGQEEYHQYKFNCRQCKQPITIALRVNYEHVSAVVELKDNAVPALFGQEGTIVNLDANFLIPEELQGVDAAFPRLSQMHEMAKKALERNPNLEVLGDGRRPDYLAEWNELRKAWALRRAGQIKLEEARTHKSAHQFYPQAAPETLSDWAWRFSARIEGPVASEKVKALIDELGKIHSQHAMEDFLNYYESHMMPDRGQRYLSIFREFFDSYSDFAQVLFLLHGGLDIEDGATASSMNFDKTKMFYGNAFEILSSHVDLLACLNNIAQGRKFDTFATMTLPDYYKLDKASRFNPFLQNPPLAAMCEEADNQIRNASHHGSLVLNEASGMIEYRSGKGGGGPLQQMSYANYLAKCCTIFFEIAGILQLELVMQVSCGTNDPL